MTINGSQWHIIRTALGLSNAQLAKRVGRGPRTIASYELREYDPTPETENKITEEFNTMLTKLEPLISLRTGTSTRTFWLYRTTEELHQATGEEYATWNIEMYRQYLAHAITILSLKKIPYRILSPEHDA